MSKIIDKMTLSDGREIVFRYATLKDLKPVWNFYNKVIQETEFLSHITPVKLSEEKKWFYGMLKKVRKKDATYILVTHDNKVIGSSSVDRKFEQNQKHVGTFGISILQEFTGKGIGKKLMQLIEEDSKKLNIEIMFLCVYGKNLKAYGLYRKKGFEEIGKIPKGIKRGQNYDDDILMYKVLK